MSGRAAQRWAREVSEPLAPGTVIAGRFEVTDVLGRGGMGSVYEAEDRTIGRAVAVKLLEVQGADGAERFALEARAASRISSRHAAAIYDFGQDPAHGHYMVMELLRGGSLADVLVESDRLAPSEACAVGADIAEALAAAHAAGVVHRDLKPGNVMVLEEGGIKVVDFGIARVIEGTPALRGRASSPSLPNTAPETILGTPAYISPEAVRGDTVGPSADLYALGVMLFEMVTGSQPFYDEVPIALCTLHLREPAPALADVAPGLVVPEGFAELVDALLEKDADARPRSAREVATSLRAMSDVEGPVRLLASARHDAGAETAYVPKNLPRSRAPAIGAGIAVAILAALSGTTLAIVTAGEEPARPDAPRAEPDDAPGAPVAEALPEPRVERAQETVTVIVETRPPRASLRLDGALVTPPLTLPADGREHTLEIAARGHETETRTFVADRDAHLEVVLSRARAGRRLPAKLREW